MGTNRRSTLAFTLPLAVAALSALASCSAPAPSDSTTGASSASLQIYFPTATSAFDGVHDFKVPAMVNSVTGLRWSVSDPSLVDIEVSADGSQVMMTTKGAGQVTLTARSGSIRGTAQLTIRKADPAEYDNGKARYNDGVTFQPGGFRHPDPTLACTNCHAAGGMDIEHTPTQTAGYSDQDLIAIMTTGTKPPGVAQRVMPFAKWHALHQWKMSSDEQQGLITYLRALEPQSQGIIDFGGHGGHGDHDGGGPPSSNPPPSSPPPSTPPPPSSDAGGPPPPDGTALYAQYCASCHQNSKKGSSASSIQTAIDDNTGGMGTLSNLTPAQVAAIAAAP